MKKKHYLSQRERERIDAEYNKNPVYRHLRSVAFRAEELATYFSLSAEDLFYHSMYTLDKLIEKIEDSEEDETQYCNNLWQELKSHFSEKIECEDEDHKLAASLIVSITCNLLRIWNKAKYWTVCDLLVKNGKEADEERREKIENIIEQVLYDNVVFQDLQKWLKEYAKSLECLSDEIGDVIEEQRAESRLLTLENTDDILDSLREFFMGNKDEADAFLSQIHGQSDLIVIDTIVALVRAKPKKMNIKNKMKLWRLLHDNDFYATSYQNFSTLLKDKGI